MVFSLVDFFMASLLMGLGIGADVAIATFARANQLTKSRNAVIWIAGVSLTHTIFPMLGYLLTYFSLQLQPNIEPIVGLLAFSFIFFYLKGELSDFIAPKAHNKDRQIFVTLGLILAVSWDALWSGPAKSAQVVGWPEVFIWMSFIVVGLFVLALATLSLHYSLRFKHLSCNTPNARWCVYWLQYTVVGYFGLLALFNYTFGWQFFWWQTLMISGVIIALCMRAPYQRLAFKQLKKIKAL